MQIESSNNINVSIYFQLIAKEKKKLKQKIDSKKMKKKKTHCHLSKIMGFEINPTIYSYMQLSQKFQYTKFQL